jgi:hypothetical protein
MLLSLADCDNIMPIVSRRRTILDNHSRIRGKSRAIATARSSARNKAFHIIIAFIPNLSHSDTALVTAITRRNSPDMISSVMVRGSRTYVWNMKDSMIAEKLVLPKKGEGKQTRYRRVLVDCLLLLGGNWERNRDVSLV